MTQQLFDEKPETALAVTKPDAFSVLDLAIREKTPVDALEKLVALAERMEDRKAATEFNRALQEFQSKCPPITKDAEAEVETQRGGTYRYNYAELPEIARAIAPYLREVGLSYTWDGVVKEGMVTSMCTLRHIAGHFEMSSFTCPTTSKAGMSEQQKFAAANTYAMRYSLIQVLGLTTCDPDTDAAPSPETKKKKREAPVNEFEHERAYREPADDIYGPLREKMRAHCGNKFDRATRLMQFMSQMKPKGVMARGWGAMMTDTWRKATDERFDAHAKICQDENCPEQAEKLHKEMDWVPVD